MPTHKTPELSVVVVVYRMPREAPRTLTSLSSAYQGVAADRYEVLVVENPSDEMLSAEQVRSYGDQFRYLAHPVASVSPAAALNWAARQARGTQLALMIDGARILSPGVLRRMLAAARLYEQPVVATLGFHLGPDNQARSLHRGYDQRAEDELLARVDWQRDGYQLFTISSQAGSCDRGWFFPIRESNCLALHRQHFEQLGGYSEAFCTPGGGFVNLDFYERAVSDPQHPLVILLGEGSFHQFHGGAATNRRNDDPIRQFRQEYEQLRGRPFAAPQVEPILLGSLSEAALGSVRRSIRPARSCYRQRYPSMQGSFLAATLRRGRRLAGAARAALGVFRAPRPRRDTPDRSWVEAAGAAPPAPRAAPRALTVLGMHRSGTSCLAGTLMECGVYFGDVSRQNPHNAKGNNENQQIIRFHERLLADNGGCWKSPPAEVHWSPDHFRLLEEIVQPLEASRHACWGFKDPRSVLALDGWQQRLPALQRIGIFRHPEAVALSLWDRNHFPREKGLELWLHYNRCLLAAHEREPFPLLYFTADDQFLRAQLETLVGLLGLHPPDEGLHFFEPSLRHNRPLVQDGLPVEIKQLFSRLQQAAVRPRMSPASRAA